MQSITHPIRPGNSHVYHWIVAMLFLRTTINHADRSASSVAGMVAGIIGRILSDCLIAARHSLTFSRKLPVMLAMGCATAIVLSDVTNNLTLVIALMALSFFGKGIGVPGWAIMRYPLIVGPTQRFVLAEPGKNDCSAITSATHA